MSTLTTGMHSVADVLFAAALFPLFRRYDAVWQILRTGAERVANSWREWRVGPIRIISHGFYTGIGGAVGAWIAGRYAGHALLPALLIIGVVSLITSALWAQFVEGSSKLLRPLGYYGGILGGLISAGLLALAGTDMLPLLGALALAMPWVQAAGRFRCLVQGCCHGGPTAPHIGICYWHSRSRVTQIAGLTGVPLYPTPLYSILSNIVIGSLLLRLWTLHASPALVIGLYFILTSASRFVEEAYRQEPQTPVYARLHLYQWLALAGFLVGIMFSTLNVAPPPEPTPATHPVLITTSLLLGLVSWFMTGVDFPRSNRPFSRLAPADEEARLLSAEAGKASESAAP